MIPKFRAWDKRSKEMWKVSTLHIEDEYADLFKKNIYENPLNDQWAKFEDIILMQSTGLKDKNGVEIFEGDIVQYRDGEYSYLGIVKRDCYQFFIDGIEPDDSYDFIDVSNTFDGTSSLEVIGNIHENPELLEVAE
ncbi:YopX family protein [Enterococcus sp. DIV1758]|uniref:YopX family protein n=1 Tax=Enterococcus sp. DIV1758 TaxID=2774744 RepID=UPI003F29EA2C